MDKKTTTPPAELQAAFTEADKQLKKAQQDIKSIDEFIARFAEIKKNIGSLEDFYQSEMWMEGSDTLHELFPDTHFASAGEDSIWDVSQSFYSQELSLMKILIDDLYYKRNPGVM